MSEQRLGPSITEAVNWLHQIHRDCAAMLAALDAQFAERGWEPLKKHYVGTVMATMNQADHWLLDVAYRGYVPAGTADETSSFIAATVDFEPPQTWTEPVCLITAALFAAPKTREKLWNTWDRDDAHRVVASAGGGNVRPANLDALCDTYLSGASSCFAGVVPLCELRSAGVLLERIVEPVLRSLPIPSRG